MKKSLSLFALVFSFFALSAQELPMPTNIQSPNAASLGQYGDIPVSYYTGSPDISVPLYSLNDQGIPLNVELSYDGSGVRVNSMPSWVGQNWSLQAGGVITRLIKAVPDEQHKPTSSAWYGEYTGYFDPDAYSLLDNTNWDSEANLYSLYLGLFPDVSANVKGKEFEPDIFTFNFMGYTGKFFMGEDGNLKVSSNSNLKIIINQDDLEYPFNEPTYPINENTGVYGGYLPATKMIYKITIIDEIGNTYVFGNTDGSVEYSVDFFLQNEIEWRSNSWYLTEVKNRFNEVVYEFEYERDDYIAAFYPFLRSVTDQADFDEGILGFDFDCLQSSYTNGYGGNLISPVYLKTIKTIRGDITFNRQNTDALSYTDDSVFASYLTQQGIISLQNQFQLYYLLPYYATSATGALSKLKWKKLSSITGLSKSINFSYNDLPPNNPKKRLALLNLSIDNRDYQFEYNDIEGLPKFMSTSVDHYGYFDGSPWNTFSFTNHHLSRVPEPVNAQKGILTKITYPTKGWTEFDWEPNVYSSYMSDDKSNLVSVSNTVTGGLRIKEIRNNDNKGNVNTKQYKYVKNYANNPSSSIGSGIIENIPKYHFDDYRIESYQYNPGQYVLHRSLFSTNPILPMTTSTGVHMGYSEVIEITPNNGYTIYKYNSNEDIGYRDEYDFYALNPDPSPYLNYSDKSLLRGKMKSVSVYNQQGDLLQETSNHYDFDNTKFVKGVYVYGFTCGYTAGNGFLIGSPYKLYYFDNNLVRQETRTYENGQEMVNETEYTYEYYPSATITNGSQHLKSKKTQTYSLFGNSDEEYYEENYTYTFEDPSAIYTELTNDNYIGLLQTEISKNGNLLSTQKIEYDYFGASNTILPKSLKSAKANSALEERQIIDDYTDDRKQVEKAHTIDGIYSEHRYYKRLVGNYFRTLPYPMFKIEGKELTSDTYLEDRVYEINHTGLNHDQILLKQQLVRSQYPEHLVTSYTYYPTTWNIRTVTDPKGITQYYFYDTNERLIRIEDKDGNTLKQFYYNYSND